ncbi:MAG: hypothetical protein ACYCZA_01820 [Thiobacillus sp.]
MSFDVQARLNELNKLFRTPTDNEIHRHIVVASIAALQTFHRGTIISIVDSGDEFKARAAEKVTEKFSMKDALTWLSGKTASFGELVAHSAPCNSVTDLLSWLDILLACDMKQAMSEAIDPYDLRNEVAAPARVVSDIDRLLIDLAEAFRLRHIFAHEAASEVSVSADQTRLLLEAVNQWIRAADAVLWTTVHKDLPLTQSEMNEHAGAEVIAARKELADAMKIALRDARKAGTASWLRSNHLAWSRVTMDWTRNTYAILDGTMWRAVGGSDLAKAIQSRTEQVRGWNSSLDSEGAL